MSNENLTEFEVLVKRRKAVEWLLVNDPLIANAAHIAKRCPVSAILLGAEYGATFEAKISEVFPRMEVTEQDRLGDNPQEVKILLCAHENLNDTSDFCYDCRAIYDSTTGKWE